MKRRIYLRMKALEEAREIFFSRFDLKAMAGTEEIPTVAARGRVTAAPVIALRSSPAVHQAAMDGFAVAAAATFGATPENPKHLGLDRIKEFVHSRKFWLALGGIVMLAFAVNLVELICSAGFPVVYIQVLSLTPLPFWQYYLYLLGYIFFYMLDDMIVFVVAMITLQMLGVGAKYKQACNLVGGVLMLIIGILLIFKPEALLFG
jgi:hypothetical protein